MQPTSENVSASITDEPKIESFGTKARSKPCRLIPI